MNAPTPSDLVRPVSGWGCLPWCGLRWDRGHAHLAARAAAVVYERDDPGAAFRSAGWSLVRVLEDGCSTAVVAVDSRIILVSLRGSNEPRDWLDNFSAWRRSPPYPEVVPRERMHAGVSRHLGRLLITVGEAVSEGARFGARSVLITGHSLGGGLAAPCALGLRRLGAWDGPTTVYTFNSPRVWSRTSALALEAGLFRLDPTQADPIGLWRVVTVSRGELDPVTRVPQRACGYRHVGRTVVLDGHAHYEGADAYAQWRSRQHENPVGRLAGWRIISRLARGVTAHAIRNAVLATAMQAPPEVVEGALAERGNVAVASP